jgi:hypothetical protein
VPLSAVDSVSPAIEHAKAQLFRPFRLGQWSRLALVGLFAGEMSSGGGCGNNFKIPSHTGAGHRDLAMSAFPDPWIFGPLIIGLLIAIPFVWLLFMYVSSRMRFVLFDSVIAKRCEIRRMWGQRGEPALRYFLWQIVLSLISLAGIVIIIGVPALFALALGWFTAPRDHLVGWILAGIIVFFVVMTWAVLAILVHVFTKDFVVPQMALEGISAFEGWGRLWKMLKSEKGGYAGYAGMKLLLAIGAAFIFGILTFVVLLVLLIPVGGVGAIGLLIGHAAGMGLTWNVFTITLAIVVGCIFLLAFMYCVSLISVPAIVFFPAYSIHFFAGRYPLLGNLLYPPPPPAPPVIAPPMPPPIAPIPEPGPLIG